MEESYESADKESYQAVSHPLATRCFSCHTELIYYSRISKTLWVVDLINIHNEESTIVVPPASSTQPGWVVLVVGEKVRARYAIAKGDTKVFKFIDLCLKPTLANRVDPCEGVVGKVRATSFQSTESASPCVEIITATMADS